MAKYNESIRDVFGLGKTVGEVGLELEMEGRGFIRGNVGKHWGFHQDGSLRGEENAEYVLHNPIPRAVVPSALHELMSELKKTGTRIRKDSPNTSVHVHLNVQEWSVKKVYNLICLWHIFEMTLTKWCGEDRVGNLFCLRGADAEASLMRLASAVRYSRYATLADQDGLRYTALNYTALGKFGSLEFRCLGGVYDEDTVNLWVRILLALKDYAERFVTPSDIVVEMSRLGHDAFLHEALPGDLWRAVSTKDVIPEMQSGMRLIQSVAYAVNWDRDNEVKKKELKPGPGVVEVDPDGEYPNYVGDAEDNEAVREYIRNRELHEVIRHNRAAGRRNRGLELVGIGGGEPEEAGQIDIRPGAVRPGINHFINENPFNPAPPPERLPGNLQDLVWMFDRGGQRQRVHPDNVPRRLREGWRMEDVNQMPVPPPQVLPEMPPALNGNRWYRDREGELRSVHPDNFERVEHGGWIIA